MKAISIKKAATAFAVTALAALAVTGAVSASAADTQVSCYKGDVNIDYEVNIKDLSFMYKYINHTKDDFTSDQLEIADVNGDGDVNIKDYSLVYKHINKTKEIQPNHSYVETVVAPTETGNGYTLHKCSVCGDEYRDNYVNYDGQPVTEPTTELTSQTTTNTATEPTTQTTSQTATEATTKHTHDYVKTGNKKCGLVEYACSCGDSYWFVSANSGHTWDEEKTVVVAATCEEQGYTSKTCSVCGETYKVDIVDYGHDYVETVVAPTCTLDGYTLKTCSICGESEKCDEVDAIGHDYWVASIVSPTETEYGYTLYKCANCGDSYKDDCIDIDGNKVAAPLRSNVEVTGVAKTWLEENIINTDLSTLEKVKLINEYTRELSKGNDNIFDAAFAVNDNDNKNSFYEYFHKAIEMYYDGLAVGSGDGGYAFKVLELGGAQYCETNTTKGIYQIDYSCCNSVFLALCDAAGIELYDAEDFYYVIENGIKYYTCPVLNSYSVLGKYGAEDVNTYTNMPEGSDILEQCYEQTSIRNDNLQKFNTVMQVAAAYWCISFYNDDNLIEAAIDVYLNNLGISSRIEASRDSTRGRYVRVELPSSDVVEELFGDYISGKDNSGTTCYIYLYKDECSLSNPADIIKPYVRN